MGANGVYFDKLISEFSVGALPYAHDIFFAVVLEN